MKEYNRKTKLWEEVSTEKVGNLKKVDKCKGFPAHDYRLCLPSYFEHRGIQDTPEEIVEKWYESEQRICDFKKAEAKIQFDLGLGNKYHDYEYSNTKHYRCANCGKMHYN